MSDLLVRKRDGQLESWNYDKALTSIGKAMMPIKRAEKIASLLEKWAKDKAKKGIIDSDQVRDKVVELLKDSDPASAKSYEVYKKP